MKLSDHRDDPEFREYPAKALLVFACLVAMIALEMLIVAARMGA